MPVARCRSCTFTETHAREAAGAERTLRPFERLLDVLESFADRVLSAIDLLQISAAADERLRQANHLGQLVVADLVRGLGELARRFALIAAGGARRTVQIGLERTSIPRSRAASVHIRPTGTP